MKRKCFLDIILALCLLAGVAFLLPPVRRAVFTGILMLEGTLGVPFDDASARVPHVGTYQEYEVYDPLFDVLIYHFDGRKGSKPIDVMSAGLKAIRKGGFRHRKKLSLVIFCNLTSTNKSNRATYPYGLLLESAAIRDPASPTKDLTINTPIETPLDFDYRVGDSFYRTNNRSETWAQISENPNYTQPTMALEAGWIMHLRDLTNKAEVQGKFGIAKYYVRERGTYSEVYPVDEGTQAGGVRVWYEGENVMRTGCIMTNK